MSICLKVMLFYPENELSWSEALALGSVLSITNNGAIVNLLK
jgi:NhaP-type Na+/H+ or K+/H+ antiporter